MTWLEGQLCRKRFRSQLAPHELQVLEAAVVRAREHLRENPQEHRKLAYKYLSELQALLASLIQPSHPLFELVFPNKLISREFEIKLAESKLLRRSAAKAHHRREERSKKYACEWEDNNAMPHCRLCGHKWNLLRHRRHHCRSCGQLVCASCSRSRQEVANSEKRKRVCDFCAGLTCK